MDDHRKAIRCHIVEHLHRATFIVAIVGVAVIGEVHRADCLERGWPMHGNLNRVEAAIRSAEHPYLAVTPRLLCHPGNRFDSILLFLHRILIAGYAARAARTTHVNAQGRKATLGKIGMRPHAHRPINHPCGRDSSQRSQGIGQAFRADRDRHQVQHHPAMRIRRCLRIRTEWSCAVCKVILIILFWWLE